MLLMVIAGITIGAIVGSSINSFSDDLPFYQQRLLALKDHRITDSGVIVIKSQQYRSQERNRVAAIERLVELIRSVAVVPKARRATRPSKRSKQKRVDQKVKRGQIKRLRGKVDY